MRNIFSVVAALCGLSTAIPQMIDIGPANAPDLGPNIKDAVPNAITYDQAAATASAAGSVATAGAVLNGDVSDACARQPGGAGPVPGNGSVAAYLDTSNDLRTAARAAGTPTGYRKEFTDEQGSSQQIGYLTYKNIEDGTYNVDECADFCNSQEFCLGFNIYFERDPRIKPASNCTDPDPITNVKCAIHGYPVSKLSATNKGQFRQKFQVVIIGSNGYSRVSPSCRPAPFIDEYNPPTNLKAAINAPLIIKNGTSYDTYNGMRLFTTSPFDPVLCAAACKAQTEYDKNNLVKANGEYKPCNFFTSYILTQNGVPLGTYCALYTQAWNESYAVNTGYTNGGDVYEVICAASYNATNPDPGKVVA